MRQPMAIAIIGGLVSSTLLTLLVVPAVYSLLDPASEWFRRHVTERKDRMRPRRPSRPPGIDPTKEACDGGYTGAPQGR